MSAKGVYQPTKIRRSRILEEKKISPCQKDGERKKVDEEK